MLLMLCDARFCAQLMLNCSYFFERPRPQMFYPQSAEGSASNTKLHGWRSQTPNEFDVGNMNCRLPTYPIPIMMSRVLWLGIEVVVQV